MTASDTLARMISEREQDIAALQAELNVLHGLETPRPAPRANGAEAWRGGGTVSIPTSTRPDGRLTRQQMLARIVRDAGRAGLTRKEAIERMAAICDSPPNSVAQMLSLLARKSLARAHPDGKWRATR